MAHGNPRINICHDCKQYLLVNRFSSDPICPNCGKLSEQTDKDKIRSKYNVAFGIEFTLSFKEWTKLTEK